MLTLSRKENEAIILYTSDGPITLCISSIQHNQVRVSFDAPDNVNIVREELLSRADFDTAG